MRPSACDCVMWRVNSTRDVQRLALLRFRASAPASASAAAEPASSSSGAARGSAAAAQAPTATARRRRSPSKRGTKRRASTRERRGHRTPTEWEVKPARALGPGRRAYQRGSASRLGKLTRSPLALSAAISAYELGKLARSSRNSIQERVAFWVRRAAAHGVTPWPIDVDKLKLLGTLLHAGKYRSAAGYFSAVKRAHILAGGTWTPQLAQEVRDGTRSCTRGQGPDKQSAEVDLDALAAYDGALPKVRALWPAAGRDAVLVMGFWLLREIEGGSARLADVVFLPGAGCGKTAWVLPCSKTDLRALGHRRVHGCSCPDPACPTAAMRRVVKVAQEVARRAGHNQDEAPLLPNSAGAFVEKKHMIACFQEMAALVGVAKGVTGHMPRVSGARRMARAGIELWQIQLFARWESSVILRYVREAPLERSHLLARRLRKEPDLAEMVDDAVGAQRGGLPRLEAEQGAAWAPAVVQAFEQACGGQIGVEKLDIDKQACVDAAMEAIAGNEQDVEALPSFVLNGRPHHTQSKVHRPRDSSVCFCGWQWSEAPKSGVAVVLEKEAVGYVSCKACTKAAARREVGGRAGVLGKAAGARA